MAKASKHKLLFSTVILTALLFFSVYAALVPSVHAAEASIQQKSAVVTDNVIGVDSAKYATISEDYREDLYLDVIPQENLRYTLETNESKLDIYYTFVNNKLRLVHVLDNIGSPQMQKAVSANALDMSKDFLNNYQDYTENEFYGELKSTLNTVEANTNVTAVFGNMKLSVTSREDSTTFRWVYTFNGIEAPDKCVALSYEKGFLKYFIDNWDLYKIASTTVNVSDEQAMDLAMSRAKNATWSTTTSDNETFAGLKYNVTNAMVWQTAFSNSLFMDNPRDHDPLMLYPMRHIWVSFDKFYPGYYYGMNVYVWADTGEIGHSQLRFSTMDPPAELMVTDDDVVALAAANQEPAVDSEQSSPQWDKAILLSTFAFSVVGAVTVYSRRKKTRSSKISGVLLCILMVSTGTLIVAASASAASALYLHGGANIWGSESILSFNSMIDYPTGGSWRKTNQEVAKQQFISDVIHDHFALNGYDSTDNQGVKGGTSEKGTILGNIAYRSQYYLSSAAVDFDHGNGLVNIPGLPSDEFHFMFEDQRGTYTGPNYHGSPIDHPEYAVFDYDIYNNIAADDTFFFVLINACNSAHIADTFGQPPYVYDSTQGMVGDTGRARGMPYAWSHGTKVLSYGSSAPPSGWMSGDGYAVPDTGDFCYIGFVGGSAALNQDVEGKSGSPQPYWYWVYHFFADALTNDWTVKHALDQASLDIYNGNFGEIPLHTTFDAIWPMWRGDPPEWHA
jgi:hypothetical protein